jgi:hypothetical protein
VEGHGFSRAANNGETEAGAGTAHLPRSRNWRGNCTSSAPNSTLGTAEVVPLIQNAVDWLDRCSTNFGTTREQVYGSADAADSWNRIVQTVG